MAQAKMRAEWMLRIKATHALCCANHEVFVLKILGNVPRIGERRSIAHRHEHQIQFKVVNRREGIGEDVVLAKVPHRDDLSGVRGEAILAGATVGSLHATDSSWSFADGVLELGFVRGESARACSDFNLLFKRFQVSSCRCSTFNMLAGQFWLSKSAVVTCSRFLEVH